jgi:hypothetical protein
MFLTKLEVVFAEISKIMWKNLPNVSVRTLPKQKRVLNWFFLLILAGKSRIPSKMFMFRGQIQIEVVFFFRNFGNYMKNLSNVSMRTLQMQKHTNS